MFDYFWIVILSCALRWKVITNYALFGARPPTSWRLLTFAGIAHDRYLTKCSKYSCRTFPHLERKYNQLPLYCDSISLRCGMLLMMMLASEVPPAKLSRGHRNVLSLHKTNTQPNARNPEILGRLIVLELFEVEAQII